MRPLDATRSQDEDRLVQPIPALQRRPPLAQPTILVCLEPLDPVRSSELARGFHRMACCGLVSLCSERSCSSLIRCGHFARYLSKLFVVVGSDAVASPVRDGTACQAKSEVCNDQRR